MKLSGPATRQIPGVSVMFADCGVQINMSASSQSPDARHLFCSWHCSISRVRDHSDGLGHRFGPYLLPFGGFLTLPGKIAKCGGARAALAWCARPYSELPKRTSIMFAKPTFEQSNTACYLVPHLEYTSVITAGKYSGCARGRGLTGLFLKFE